MSGASTVIPAGEVLRRLCCEDTNVVCLSNDAGSRVVFRLTRPLAPSSLSIECQSSQSSRARRISAT